MFHLAKGLYENWNKKEEYSVLILGLDNAGKTTFLEQIKRTYNPNAKVIPLERITPTIGQNVHTISIASNYLKFWDLGGQSELRTLWSEYFEHCHGIIFVVDSSDKDRIEEVSKELIKIVDSSENYDGLDTSIPILMLANKQDIPDKLEVEDIKEIFNKLAEKLNARDSKVLPIIATKGEGVKDAVEWLNVRLLRNKVNKQPKYK
ncbi:hypothetical protein WICMUC_003622 [Wickerhamomyces mucosus]|uniref:ADP-ribosylation factor-like protein 3 n=1 Tax=Wickerhamomyces mucosus TaxID=1378264 RepID=A0A9P8TBY7_9ASCO|nr:hypothetical protein WICMUC_003622 [Wickerhamomyces mucosus]